MGNVRVIPLSYDQLIARAKRLTMDLARLLAQTPERYDDKVHAMPAAAPEPAESMAAEEHFGEDIPETREEALDDGYGGHDENPEHDGARHEAEQPLDRDYDEEPGEPPRRMAAE